MRKSRFTEEQIARVLRETDKGSVANVAKKHRVSAETLYRWKRKFRGVDINDVKRLHEANSEDAKLKKMLVDRLLEIDMLNESNAEK